MKLCSYLLVALLFCGNAGAQTLQQVLEYYRNTNQAELAICDSDFAKANSFYIKAFTINAKKPFRKDLTNAFGAAMDTHEYALAEKYITRLLQKGLDSESLSILRKGYQGEALQRVNAMLARHPNSWMKMQQDPLVRQIKKMVEWDRGARMYFIEQMHMSDYMTDSVYMVDATNARELRKLLQGHGGLNEDLMNATGCYIIMWHNTGATLDGKPAHVFDTLLYKAVLSFDIPVEYFAYQVADEPLKPYFSYRGSIINFPLTPEYCLYKDSIYPVYYDDRSEERINKERAKIGLPSLADNSRKIEKANEGLDTNSVFHKYTLQPQYISAGVPSSEWQLSWWLRTKGKDAKIKPAYDFANVVPHMAIGNIDRLDIDRLSFDSLVGRYRFYIKEYKMGQIYLTNWKGGKPPLCWNCHAEVIDNPKEDVRTAKGRENRSLFVPGYKLFVIQGYDGPFRLRNIQTLFDPSGVLIKVSADVSYRFNRVVTKNCGKPKHVWTKTSTKYWLNNQNYLVKLTTKKYSWETGPIKIIVTATEDLNKDANKRIMSGSMLMADTVKYNQYLSKVSEAKRKLDMAYAEKGR